MIERNKEFKLAIEFVNGTDKNIFLTGKAGTGKTTFLKELRSQSHKKNIVLAPTGVAAINAEGKTIHSIFPIPREPILSTKIPLLDNLRFSANNRELLNSLDTIVFDEASMIRADILDAVDYLLRKIRLSSKPFGGVQIVFIGDMYQLSPIANPEDTTLLNTEYASPFLIDSKVFQAMEVVYIELKKIYRQTDVHFLELLESIRTASCTDEQLATINGLYRENINPENGWITLTTHTKLAKKINDEMLHQLPGEEVIMTASVNGEFEENLHPVPMDLKIKNGAQIMLVRNDSGANQKYFNGKIGTIISIATNKLLIEFSDKEKIELEKETWVNAKYQIDEIKDRISSETLGTFEQFPIRLAWAITIHKSQGLTFDCAVIDAGASFAPGQVYVAFSRLRSLQNVWLRSKITRAAISFHAVITRFENLKSGQVDLEPLLQLSENSYFRKILKEAFNWQFLEECVKTIPPLNAAIFSQFTADLIEDLKHAGNFQKIISETNIDVLEDASKIKERINAARIYFENRQKVALDGFRAYVRTNKNDIHHKRNIPLAQSYIKAFNKILSLLILAEQLTTFSEKRVSMGEALNSIKNVHPQKSQSQLTVPNQSFTNEEISLSHFREGNSIQEIANLRNLNPQTIEYHLASFIRTGEVKITELIDTLVLEDIYPTAKQLLDFSLMNLKKHFGQILTLGQLAALREYLL